MFVTFFDTCMTAMVAIFVWRLSPFLVLLPWLTIACMDGAFLSSVLTKVPDGAWFTLTLAAVLASFLLLWRFGKEQQWFAEAEDRFPTSHFVRTNSDGTMQLSERFQSTPVSSTRGMGIFFDKAGETTPIVFSQFVLKLTAIPEVVIFFHLRPLETPSVPAEIRHTVSRLGLPNTYRLVVRYGYNDEIISPDLASVICDQVRNFLINEHNKDDEKAPHRPVTIAEDGTDAKERDDDGDSFSEKNVKEVKVTDDIITLERAYQHKVLYIMGKEQMKITKGTKNYIRNVLLWVFLWIRVVQGTSWPICGCQSTRLSRLDS
jgi:KUP system potassium uptake protein